MKGPAPLPIGRDARRRRRHVEEVRRLVREGRYRVDPEAVAEAIIEHLAARRDH